LGRLRSRLAFVWLALDEVALPLALRPARIVELAVDLGRKAGESDGVVNALGQHILPGRSRLVLGTESQERDNHQEEGGHEMHW